MRFLFLSIFVFFFAGCVQVQKGDYITYEDDNYIFLENNFLTKSIDCVELGKMKDTDLLVKYCVSKNYASQTVEGFVFEHSYDSLDERFIGATLSFRKGDIINIPCASEISESSISSKEYINCIVSNKNFYIYGYLVNSKEDVRGQLRAAVGVTKVFNGVIDDKGKAAIKKFRDTLFKDGNKNWKKSKL